MDIEGRPWPVISFTIVLVTTSVKIPEVGGYGNSQVLARSDHNWSGCGIVAHPAPQCDSREKPVVYELVLEGSLQKGTVTTDG